jgi:hypothetical protein
VSTSISSHGIVLSCRFTQLQLVPLVQSSPSLVLSRSLGYQHLNLLALHCIASFNGEFVLALRSLVLNTTGGGVHSCRTNAVSQGWPRLSWQL